MLYRGMAEKSAVCGLLWASLVFSGSFARAATEQIGDWEIICTNTAEKIATPQKPTTKFQGSCRMMQNHTASKTGKTVFLVSIFPPKKPASKPQKPSAFLVLVSVPLGVYLAPGITIRVDKGRPFKLLYEACNKTGCHAGYALKPVILKQYQRGQWAHHTLYDSKQKALTIKVSLKGFSKALAALRGKAL